MQSLRMHGCYGDWVIAACTAFAIQVWRQNTMLVVDNWETVKRAAPCRPSMRGCNSVVLRRGSRQHTCARSWHGICSAPTPRMAVSG